MVGSEVSVSVVVIVARNTIIWIISGVNIDSVVAAVSTNEFSAISVSYYISGIACSIDSEAIGVITDGFQSGGTNVVFIDIWFNRSCMGSITSTRKSTGYWYSNVHVIYCGIVC